LYFEGKEQRGRERKRVPFHISAETGIPICTKDRSSSSSNYTWNWNTNPTPSYEVSLFCYEFSCLRFGGLVFPLGPCFSMYFDHFCLKVCHFFASSFMGIWLFAGSASLYVFLRFEFYHFFTIALGYSLFRIGQLGHLCIMIIVIMINLAVYFIFLQKWMLGVFCLSSLIRCIC